MKYQEKFIESLNSIGDKRIIEFNNKVVDYLRERIKGSVEVYFDMNLQEFSYRAHIDYDDRYFSENIKFDEIIKSNMNAFMFCDFFIRKIVDYYTNKILN